MTVKVCSTSQLLHGPIWGTVSRNSEQVRDLNSEYFSRTEIKKAAVFRGEGLVPGWKSFHSKNEDLSAEKSI